MMLKNWAKPEIFVISRYKVEECVLTWCKGSTIPGTNAQNATYNNCAKSNPQSGCGNACSSTSVS